MRRPFTALFTRWWTAAGLLLLLSSCEESARHDPKSGASPQKFESDIPRAAWEQASQAGADAGAAASAESDSAADRGSAERAIVEADIIQTAGNRLYALSRSAGLSVIDITDANKLSILGRYRELSGTPFEMYLRDGVALVMFSDWGQYVREDGGEYKWVQTSKVVALNVGDPAHIQTVGSFDVAGEVSDSRLVGDVMYVVGFQNGYCWGCRENRGVTSLLSLNIRDVAAIHRVDELQFEDATGAWGRRSVTVTDQRMYVAGPEWGATSQPTGSQIQVIDISNPDGHLVPGAAVRVDGQITSRWQMDEYQGVLRVVSQPWRNWSSNAQQAPSVQTFKVASSQQLTSLGRTELVIPRNETLRSVRFDGPRGYAITALQTDPLFTLDLSDPSAPRQVGELEMPGFIHHMEPRGDRLIGLGFDQGNPQGGLTVSVFDVRNLAEPQMLSRVNFGGSWGRYPEDQDRIHKAFRVLPELNAILVPFSGWSDWTPTSECRSEYRSGIQVVDYADDRLTLRGVAPSRGEARRAIVHGGTLLAVSDDAVDTYDLTNRDKLTVTGRLTLARNVGQALSLGDGRVARISRDWYAQASAIDIVRLEDVERADLSLGELDLSEALTDDRGCIGNTWISDAFARGTQLEVHYSRYQRSGSNYKEHAGIVIVDAAGDVPQVLSKVEWLTSSQETRWWPFQDYFAYGYYGAQRNTIRVGQALALLEARSEWRDTTQTQDVRLRVIDLRDPANPKQTVMPIPRYAGYGGLVADGDNLMFSHFELNAKEGRGHFYLDRVDLSDPSAPKLRPKQSIPGVLMHQDRSSGRALTVELVRADVEGLDAEECYARFAHAEFRYRNDDYRQSEGTCTGYTQKLHLVQFVPGGVVLTDTHQLGERDRISSSAFSGGRVAAILSHGYAGWFYRDCFGPCGYGGGADSEPAELMVIGGLDTGVLELGRTPVGNEAGTPWWGFWGSPSVYAHGSRVLVVGSSDALVVDVGDVGAPSVVRRQPTYGYIYHVEMEGDSALLSLGSNGVQRIPL